MSIGAYLPIVDVLLRMPIIGIVSLFPSINGLGLREGATVVFFAPMIGKEKALAVGILWFFILLVTSLIGGAIYALSPKLWVKFREIEKERETI
jgi:phosphate/sulfate permease